MLPEQNWLGLSHVEALFSKSKDMTSRDSLCFLLPFLVSFINHTALDSCAYVLHAPSGSCGVLSRCSVQGEWLWLPSRGLFKCHSSMALALLAC